MKNPFLKPKNPILKKISIEIPEDRINSLEIKKLIAKMIKIAHGERSDKKRPIMVGLAAPQIGISKQIILVAVGATRNLPAGRQGKVGQKRKIGKMKVYINPKIIWKSKVKEEWYEGCYSIPGVNGIVSRSKSIKVQALNVIEKHSGFAARIFQHEIDHLNGKFFINHIKNPNHLHKVKPEEFSLYRKNWKNWPKKFSYPLASKPQEQV